MSTVGAAAVARRMKNPALVIPEGAKAIQELTAAAVSGGVPATTMALVHLRVGQINGCSVCVEHGQLGARRQGESEERLFAVSAWRDSPRFDEKERAALSLAESMTRMSDRADPVPDEVWNEAARHYDERQLAALVLWIALANLYNRLNVTTRQLPASGG